MRHNSALTLLSIGLGLLLLVSCSQPNPTHTLTTQPLLTNTSTPTITLAPEPTHTSTATPTHTPQPTLTATNTPEPTPTSTPTTTPQPQVIIQVMDKESGEPLPGATVQLEKKHVGFEAQQTTNTDGQVVFVAVRRSNWAYKLTVTARGYHDAVAEIVVKQGENDLTLSLTPGVFAHVTVDAVILRGGPGTIYGVVGEASKGDVLTVVGQSEDGKWLIVDLGEGQTGWLDANLVSIQGELARAVAMAPPPTPTPTPIPPTSTPTAAATAPPPPQAAPPTGANLLANPGFEDGGNGWQNNYGGTPHTYSLSDHPQFIRSGDKAARYFAFQHVYNVTPGVTYRLGAWGRVWSSPDEDRTVSKDPGDIAMYVCINIVGDDRAELETSVCGASGNPIDTWQYFTVDAVASNDQITVILVSVVRSGPRHNETFWDDVHLGLSPVAATPTPIPEPPPGAPVRPAPVPFDGVALRDSMAHLQWVLEQMGGLLDRVYNGEYGSCPEYESYYRQTVEINTYHSIPGDWQAVYNEYIWAADNVVATNEAISSLCLSGGGGVTALNYSVARTGVLDSVARLIPAIQTANALLGQ